MQQHEIKNNLSEVDKISQSNLGEAFFKVVEEFNLMSYFSGFDVIKRCGLKVSSGLMILLVLPFYGIESVWMMYRLGFSKQEEFENSKGSFYAIKNNEKISWRYLLSLLTKRFLYLISKNNNLKKEGVKAIILDDSALSKSGKSIEGVSRIHDHVSGNFIFGYKLLVCGFWDGGSFIPLDFSLHREKSKKLKECQQTVKRLESALELHKETLTQAKQKLSKAKSKEKEAKLLFENNPKKTNQKKYQCSQETTKKKECSLQNAKKQLEQHRLKLESAAEELKNKLKSGSNYGLSKKDYDKQYSKKRSRNTSGSKRKKELDISKIENGIKMIQRAVTNGFIPDYVLTDSWFFCLQLLNAVNSLEKQIHLISMAKIGTAKYTLLSNGMDYYPTQLISLNQRQSKYSKKIKAHYIKLRVLYQGQRIDMYFIRMGRNTTWRLLVTTDLNISFPKLIETYQIRWSIEVFFKDCKQYLQLGKCQSNDFDAQIADTSMSLIRYLLLSYYKRVHYQQTIGGLFAEISQQIIEASLAEKLWMIFIKLLIELSEINGIDISEVFIDLLRNEKVGYKILKFLENEEISQVA